MDLRYQSGAMVEELALGGCTIRHTRSADGKRVWWQLWLHVRRDDTGEPAVYGAPLNVNGEYVEDGPGGRTWGFRQAEPGAWRVTPSINVVCDVTPRVHPGPHPLASQWHRFVCVTGVPEGEPWQRGP